MDANLSNLEAAMNLTKRTVESLEARPKRYFVWDRALKGFGVRVEPTGRKTFLCRYRVSGARRQYLLGVYGAVTAEEARSEARRVLSSSALGKDLAQTRYEARRALRFGELVEIFLAEHVSKLKPGTVVEYNGALRKHAVPALGRTPADAVTTSELNRLHMSLIAYRARANRVISYIRSLYSWAGTHGYVPRDFNPARYVKHYKEQARERYLSSEELKLLGEVLRQAETTGLAWIPKAEGKAAKHRAKPEKQFVVYPPDVTGAIRLLLFTGCRLREILHLRWGEVDLERGLLHLPDSKTGKKTVVLNTAAVDILKSLSNRDVYVIPGDVKGRPRHDLKRPWDHIRHAAALPDVRLHDLRHTHASFGVASGLGLPIIGRLLGHASPLTTARYAHLADDPVRRASDIIGTKLSQLVG
jgi:integrase